MERRLFTFCRFAWGVLAYILLVILWGAYVRATGSGAGCGGHWPLCNGQIVPPSPGAATIIEYAHRLTSGLSLVLVAALCAWAFRLFPPGHPVRCLATLSGLFLVLEALLGAGLVLLDYVAMNASAGRVVYLSAHFVNTQVLLGLLALTAVGRVRLTGGRVLLATLPVALLLSVSGVLAALSDTLYPATSLQSGLQQELAPGAHSLLRLRLLHPAVAVAAGLFLLMAAMSAARKNLSPARLVIVLLFVQMGAGFVNVLLLAPVWMQILHLLVADLLWIALVILAAGQAKSS